MSYIVEQKVKGKIYLYRVEAYWDKNKQQSRQKRTYIGAKDKSSSNNVKSIPSQLITKNYGNIYLLEHIAESTGLTKTLRSCFEEEYKDILALAHYEIMESSPGYLRFNRISHVVISADRRMDQPCATSTTYIVNEG
ncbi:MAG: hypothetical protein LBC19_09090 [Tannerella sp.]|jgi:hypothetical protein|nr:hypothetical protein [Tannerella sp.]